MVSPRRDIRPMNAASQAMTRDEHCTHPEQTWCDCDWCRVVRAAQSGKGR